MSLTIHEAFRAIARRQPSAVALADGEITISYGELDAASDQLMLELLRRGLGVGSMTPFLYPRSIEQVCAVLGALKAGSAYLCIDPRWPAKRIRKILELLGSPAVLCSNRPQQDVPFEILHPPTPHAASERMAGQSEVGGLDPATVFLTSGSTGAPKAVLSPHAGTVDLVAPCRFARLNADTRMPLAAALPWDAHSLELWGTLLNGGVCLIHSGPYLDPISLRQLIRNHGANTVWLSCSIFNMIVDEDLDSMRGLSTVLIGGEKASPLHARQFLERYPDVPLINGYGPVESTIFASTHRITSTDCSETEGIPIGHAVSGTDVVIVDETRECDPNQIGEICIATRRLALGYVGDEELTSSRFINLNLDGRERRYYRTGDRGRKDVSGLLRWEGRLDRQVKIRGHRVNPSEVEAHILQIRGVVSCVVVPLVSHLGTTERLGAFYTGPELSIREFRTALSRRVPEYLIPSHFWHLSDLPLLDNGKLDRNRLHSIAQERCAENASATGCSEDGSSSFDTVRRVVTGVLGNKSLSGEESLYEVGASSLDLGRVCSQLRRRTGYDIRLADTLCEPSIAAIAAKIDSLRQADARIERTAVPCSSDPVRLEGMGAALALRQCLYPQDTAATCPVAWWLDGEVDTQALRQALADLTRRHEALRAKYRIDGGHVVATVVQEEPKLEELSVLSEDEAIFCMNAWLGKSLDIGQGEVVRSLLICTPQRTLLALAIHHVAFDGRSEQILADELSVAYNARRRQRAPVFDAEAPSLGTVCRWLAHESQRVTKEERLFWEHYLKDLPNLSCLTPGPDCQSARKLTWSIPAKVLRRVEADSKSQRKSAFHLLLKGYARAVATVTGQVDFGVGVPVSKRTDPQVERALACLINAVCVRSGSLLHAAPATKPSSGQDPPVPDLHTVLAHHALPFSDVVRMLRPARGLHSPLFQTMFVTQQVDPALGFDQCTSDFIRLWPSHTMTELGTTIWPHPTGDATLQIVYQSSAVADSTARSIGTTFLKRVVGSLDSPPSLREPETWSMQQP